MSLLYRFKPQKDRSLRSVTTHLDGARVTANEVTALGLCLALGAGRLAYYGHLYTGLILFAAGVVCDALDGSFARISTMGTEFGLYFDGVADRFSELFFVSDAVLGAHVLSFAFVLVGGGFALLLARIYGHARQWGAVSTTFGRPERPARGRRSMCTPSHLIQLT
jgi:phosphatidylglycerophosphate synthase